VYIYCTTTFSQLFMQCVDTYSFSTGQERRMFRSHAAGKVIVCIAENNDSRRAYEQRHLIVEDSINSGTHSRVDWWVRDYLQSLSYIMVKWDAQRRTMHYWWVLLEDVFNGSAQGRVAYVRQYNERNSQEYLK